MAERLHPSCFMLHPFKKQKGAPKRPKRTTKKYPTLRQEPLLLQLLAIDAEGCPGNGLEALFTDGVTAVGADPEGIALDADESLVDQHEQLALAVGEGEVELFGVG